MSKTQSRLGVTIPNQDQCLPINFYIPPFDTDVGVEAVLHVSGITNVHPLWDTWKWQTADIYGVGTVPNPAPTWADTQTGGLTYTIGGDDTMVRVILTNGDCIYWSNESGYENAFSTPLAYAEVHKDSQTFTGGSGPTKLDFTGATITNSSGGALTTSVVNDNFVAALFQNTWEITYSGHMTFEDIPTQQRLVIGVYVDGVLVNKSRQIVVVPNGDYELAFSKSFITAIPVADTLDIRFDATLGDITVIDAVVVIKNINFTT